MSTSNKFECRYCHKGFIREHAYLAHECKQMKREKELKSNQGQAALQYYQMWMKEKVRAYPNADTFSSSQYYRTFMNFADFIKRVKLPHPDKFIWLMVQKDMPPTMWMLDEVYTVYMLYVDTKIPPMDHVNTSVKTLLQFADAHDVDPSEIFDVIDTNDFIHLVRVRKLSPWLLLFSRRFKEMYTNRLSPEQQSILDTLISPDNWVEKKEQHKDDIVLIKQYIAELGI